MKTWFNKLGPVFGLALVVALFLGLLAWKDVADRREADGLTGPGSWTQAAKV